MTKLPKEIACKQCPRKFRTAESLKQHVAAKHAPATKKAQRRRRSRSKSTHVIQTGSEEGLAVPASTPAVPPEVPVVAPSASPAAIARARRRAVSPRSGTVPDSRPQAARLPSIHDDSYNQHIGTSTANAKKLGLGLEVNAPTGFLCARCDRTFPTEKERQAHEDAKHGVTVRIDLRGRRRGANKFACSRCGAKFKTEWDCRQHFKRQHSD